jgi:hypothetical protein
MNDSGEVTGEWLICTIMSLAFMPALCAGPSGLTFNTTGPLKGFSEKT